MVGAALLLLAIDLNAVAAPVAEPTIVTAPSPNTATIVFMRPSGIGIANHAPIFDLSSNSRVILGRIGAHDQIAYAATPGTHRFMVIGNRATFLDAEVAGGKVYYVLITPEPGAARPHFVFTPITASVTAIDFAGYQALTHWVTLDPGAAEWADHHKDGIDKDQATALRYWKGTPRLNAGDAR
jgi:hypothetical protein